MSKRNNLSIFLVVLISIVPFVSSDASLAQAELEISNAEKIITEMESSEFSITYVNDLLIESKRVLGQVNYAEILNGNVESSLREKKEAEDALQLIDWEELSYDDVLIYTDQINERREQAFLISDDIFAFELKISAYEEQGEIVLAKDTLEQAKNAFYEDRYEEAQTKISEAESILEEQMLGSASSNIIQRSPQVFQQYGLFILGALLVLIVSGLLSFNQIKRKLTKNKIKRMKAEQPVLMRLIKRAQEERFKKNKISGIVYNIRVKKYKDRLNEIKEELPVLESSLKKLKK